MRKNICVILIFMFCLLLTSCNSEIHHPIKITSEYLNSEKILDNEIASIDIVPASSITEENNIDKSESSFENEKDKLALKVHFIDVGQGDAIFIELPNGETLLIDAGPSVRVVRDYIEKLGYSNINYVVATHPDADHITGMPEILENFSVNKFYMPEKEHTTKIFEKMLNSIVDNGCKAIYAEAGNSILEIEDLSIKFLAPNKVYGDNNNASAVIKLKYKNNSFLFTGDAEYSSEEDMISKGYDLKADVLKVGHHASSSSTSEKFLERVNPKYAIISVGKNNKYGHPTNKVLTTLNNYKVDVYRTDEVGTVIIDCDGENYNINKLKSVIQANAPPLNVGINENKIEENNIEIKNENNLTVVYRTKTGSKYHRDGCSYLKSKIKTTIVEAENSGLTPCSRCNSF